MSWKRENYISNGKWVGGIVFLVDYGIGRKIVMLFFMLSRWKKNSDCKKMVKIPDRMVKSWLKGEGLYSMSWKWKEEILDLEYGRIIFYLESWSK